MCVKERERENKRARAAIESFSDANVSVSVKVQSELPSLLPVARQNSSPCSRFDLPVADAAEHFLVAVVSSSLRQDL